MLLAILIFHRSFTPVCNEIVYNAMPYHVMAWHGMVSSRNVTVIHCDTQIYNFNLFLDFASSMEESITIIDRVQAYLAVNKLEDQCLPWELLKSTSNRSQERSVKLRAIEEYLGVFPDGTYVPLTLRQKLFFTLPLLKLEHKICKVRKITREIVTVIDALKPWEEDAKNVFLIRRFVLECLSPFKRFTLKQVNARYHEFPIEKCSWGMYIIAWIFITATLCFFMYWIFAWGVYQGDATLAAWGAVFGTNAANDILLVQMTKIFILYYLPGRAMQSQLLRIRGVLTDVAIKYINRHDSEHKKGEENIASEICVVQHMSAACRAARSYELKDLPSAWLLRQVKSNK